MACDCLRGQVARVVLTFGAVPVAPQDHAWDGGCPPLDWLELVNRHALAARLLSATVHDVNNTLQVVSGAAEVLAMDPTPEAVIRRTDSIVAQARQATAALQALTAFVRDAGTPGGRARPKAIAEHAIGLRMYALRKARIAVSVTGDEAECAAGHGRVLQVLLNLVVNAEQALAGRAGATLAVRVTADDGAVAVSVEDNGPGLRADQIASAFTWPPAPARAPGCLGLGLFVSGALAARDGGTLTYAPGPEGGAAFRLTLPR